MGTRVRRMELCNSQETTSLLRSGKKVLIDRLIFSIKRKTSRDNRISYERASFETIWNIYLVFRGEIIKWFSIKMGLYPFFQVLNRFGGNFFIYLFISSTLKHEFLKNRQIYSPILLRLEKLGAAPPPLTRRVNGSLSMSRSGKGIYNLLHQIAI